MAHRWRRDWGSKSWGARVQVWLTWKPTPYPFPTVVPVLLLLEPGKPPPHTQSYTYAAPCLVRCSKARKLRLALPNKEY